MGREDVNIKVSANVAEAIQLWKAMEEGPDGMAKALDAMGNRGKAATGGLANEIEGMVGKWVSVGAAIKAVQQEVERYYKTIRENEEKSAAAVGAADKATRAYFTRQRIAGPEQQKVALENIGKQAMNRTSSLSSAGDAATMLAEFGFGRKEAEGDSLLELLTLQDSVSGSGGDSKTISRKVLEIIQRSGQPKTAKSIRDLGITANQLTGKAAGFDAEMMEEYSTVASDAAKGGETEASGLAMWAAIREKLDAKGAKTTFRSMMKPGTQAGEQKIRERMAALMGGNGEAEKAYQEAADIGSSGIASRQDESETANTLAMMQGGGIPRDEAYKRLQAMLQYYQVPETGVHGRASLENLWKHPGITVPLLGWSTDDMYSTEDLANRQAKMLAPGTMFTEEHERNVKNIQDQIMGRAPLPFSYGKQSQQQQQQPVQIHVNLRGPDGLDIPHEPAAANLSQ